MEYVARERGIEPIYMPGAAARDRAARRCARRARARRADPRAQAARHPHAHGEGGRGRARRRRGSPAPTVRARSCTPSTATCCSGYFDPRDDGGFRQVERTLARSTDALIAVSPEVRDDLVALGVAPAERIAVDPARARPRRAHGRRRRVRARRSARALGVPPDRFVVGWLGRMTEIKRVDDAARRVRRAARRGRRRRRSCSSATGRFAPQLERAGRRARDRATHATSSATATDVGAALRGARRGRALLCQRRNAGRRDRGARGGRARRLDRRRRRRGRRPRRPQRLPRSARRRRRRSPSGSRASPPTRAARAARRGRARDWVRARYSVPRLVDRHRRAVPLAARRADGSDGSAHRRRWRRVFSAATRTRIARAPRTLDVLLLSQYFPPEVGATQSRMQSFAEYLAARGHDVTVIAEFPNHPQGVMPARYRGHLVEDDRSNGYRVLRVWVEGERGEDAADAARLLPLVHRRSRPRWRRCAGRPDVVLATSPPLFTGVAGARARAAQRARRSCSTCAISGRLLPRSLDQISRRADARAARVGRALALPRGRGGRRGDAAVLRRTSTGSAAARPTTALIPNGTLEMFFEATPDDAVRAELGAHDGEFLVTFAGTHGIAQALPSVLDAAALVGDGVDVRVRRRRAR